MAVFGLTSQNLAPSLRAKSNKSSRRCSSWVAQVAPCSHGVLWGLQAPDPEPDPDSQCGCRQDRDPGKSWRPQAEYAPNASS